VKFRADAGFCARYQPRSGGARPHAACGRRARMSPLMALPRHSKIADGLPLLVEKRSCSGHHRKDRA
jgi:hypothetical protein